MCKSLCFSDSFKSLQLSPKAGQWCIVRYVAKYQGRFLSSFLTNPGSCIPWGNSPRVVSSKFAYFMRMSEQRRSIFLRTENDIWFVKKRNAKNHQIRVVGWHLMISNKSVSENTATLFKDTFVFRFLEGALYYIVRVFGFPVTVKDKVAERVFQ
jgi:hypothetical protein